MEESKLRIGLAVVPFEVPVGTPMGGYAARSKPSEGTHDSLNARVIVIEREKNKICLCVVDIVGLEQNEVLELKKKISENIDIPEEQILISATHTHSGPRNILIFGEAWKEKNRINEAIIEAASRANKNMFLGRIEFATGEIRKLSYNRRDFDKNSDYVDFEAVALKILDNSNKVRGILYNFSNHCVVMNPQNLMITQDWPFYTSERLKEEFGEDIQVIFFQGTPGNVNPINVPMSNPVHTFDDVKEIGGKTADGLISILKNAETLHVDKVDGKRCNVDLEMDDEDKAEIFTFAKIEKKDQELVVSTYCQAFKIGELALVGLPGEAFSEIGRDLKQKAIKEKNFKAAMVIGYANDYIGYFGPKAAYLSGGYEMLMMSLSENEGEQIINCAKSALKKLSE